MTSMQPPKKPFKFFAFGNVAVGFIAVGNVAVGVVAIGLSVAVGPIAIGINSVGVLLAVGVNSLATVALAAVNGLGVFSLAGVNTFGTFAASWVNCIESVVFAPLLLAVQIVVALALRGGPLEDAAPGLPPATRLHALVAGAAQSGPVHARIRLVAAQEISVADDEDPASVAALALGGEARADLARLPARALEGGAPVLVEVRAASELLPPSAEDNYRNAPGQRRQLWAERVFALPEPPPFWERPSSLRRVTRVSLVLGAAVSAAGLVARIVVGL